MENGKSKFSFTELLVEKFMATFKLDEPKDESTTLFLCFDFAYWSQARQWSYVSSYLVFHDASSFMKTELQILPFDNSEEENDILIRSIMGKRHFDNIVVWLPHANLSLTTLKNLSLATNQLIYIITESLIYTSKEISEIPHLADRYINVRKILDLSESKIVCLCPLSSKLLKDSGYHVTSVYGLIPEDHFNSQSEDAKGKYTFAATIYNEERKKLAHEIQGVEDKYGLTRLDLVDKKELIDSFEEAMRALISYDKKRFSFSALERSMLCKNLESLRRAIWYGFLDQLGQASFVITLPSYFKGLPGRVIEANLVGAKVIFLNTNIDEFDKNYLSEIRGLYFCSQSDLDMCVKNISDTDNYPNFLEGRAGFVSVRELFDDMKFSQGEING